MFSIYFNILVQKMRDNRLISIGAIALLAIVMVFSFIDRTQEVTEKGIDTTDNLDSNQIRRITDTENTEMTCRGSRECNEHTLRLLYSKIASANNAVMDTSNDIYINFAAQNSNNYGLEELFIKVDPQVRYRNEDGSLRFVPLHEDLNKAEPMTEIYGIGPISAGRSISEIIKLDLKADEIGDRSSRVRSVRFDVSVIGIRLDD